MTARPPAPPRHPDTEAIVHIGLNKTGTTSIQDWLESNRDALRADGTLYPRLAGDGPEDGRHQHFLGLLGFHLDGHLGPRGEVRRKLRIATPEDQARVCGACIATLESALDSFRGTRVIFSSEMIAGWIRTPRRVALLDGWFRSYFGTVRYVIYIRDPERWILSRYVQSVTGGSTQSLEEFIDKHAHAGLFRTLNLWSDTLGRDRLEIRLHDRSALAGGDVVGDFCQAAGIGPAGPSRPFSSNQSPSLGEIRAMRTLSMARRLLGLGRPSRSLRANRWIRMCATTGKIEMPPDLARRIRQANAADLEKIRLKYFPRMSRLFPRDDADGT